MLYVPAKSVDLVASMPTAPAVVPVSTTAALSSGTAGVVIKRVCFQEPSLCRRHVGFLPLQHSEKRHPKCLRDHEKPFDSDLMVIPLPLVLHGGQAVPPTQMHLLCPQLGWPRYSVQPPLVVLGGKQDSP